MALSESERFNILADLASGITPQEIEAKRDVSYATVLRLKRDFETAVANNTLDQLLDFNEAARLKLMEQVIESTPESLRAATAAALKDTAKSLDMADALKVNLQASANKLCERLNMIMGRAETASDLLIAAEALSMLQNAFFNKNMTQVNVQNNYGHQAYDGFLSDTPASDAN